MNLKMVFFTLGRVFLVLVVLLLIPLLISVISGDGQYASFLFTILISGGLGGGLLLCRPRVKRIAAKEGFAIVALSWIGIALVGAFPFLFSHSCPTYLDCVFEITSGFTTTGASILTDVEVLPVSIGFWRCFSIWIGGMGVLVFLLAVIPKADEGESIHIFRAESPGPQVGKMVSKLGNTSRILYAIYVVLTLVQTIMLLCGGLNFYESITCALSTAGTGGFYIYNESIGHFATVGLASSVYVEMVVAVFMVLFACNFNVFYLIILGKVCQALKSEELRYYAGILLTTIAALTIALCVNNTVTGVGQSLRYSFFQVASIMSTTGFATTNFVLWPQFAQMLLLLLMVVGACAGSTGGGIKVARLVLLGKSANRTFRQLVSPNSVIMVKFEGKTVNDSVINTTRTYFAAYIGLIAASVLLLSLDGKTLTTNLSAVLACINNIGPGLGSVGPHGNYSTYGILSKITLCVIMIAGRLELFPIIMLLNPRMWKKI